MENNTFRGCFVALVTPFQENGQVDEIALKELVNWQVASGIDGIVVCGTTGESVTLNEQEYRQVVQLVVGEVQGRVPVLAGAGTNNTEKTIRMAQICQEIGVDAILSVTPYYNKPTQKGLIEHYKAVAEAISLPVILYNVPGRTGVNIKAETTLELAQISNIRAVKEASGDLTQIMTILRDRPQGFAVLSGDDVLTLPIIALGGEGVISVIANQIPAEFSRLVHAALNGDLDTARILQYKYLKLMQLNFIETNPIPVKTSLAAMGKIREVFRLPLVPMTSQNRETLLNELKKLQLIR